ncbi:response regulator [Candidatus Uhrbacteria bacterium CG10_big_fil_rev_8_21_14_0_10_48_11]|uniref:Response regulator n=1 Tax=Candidatus Uhrbacteria bacterium CG10_big_fil_rev_8_21_14_0_10_48_11 TaxID=1975037 RepID=A0A2M8LFW4_9BACT|nr:MAG: response regulator [Candidatus Uhrbacteria bacterium CG10_big_fil_rev_8_21_14_0_10_48_11]
MAKQGKVVLIVEDDIPIAEMYAAELSLSGFTVEVANDGQAGLLAAVQKKPDIILLDILLPEMDGYDVLKKLKGDEKTRTIPVLLLSNLSQPEQIDRGKQLSAIDYLVKANHVPADIVERIETFFGSPAPNH